MRDSPFRDLYVPRRDLSLPLAETILTSIGSALSLAMLDSLKKDPLSFVNWSINPMDYASASTFRTDYLAVEMFSKYPHLDTGINLSEVAIAKFLSSEQTCSQTNARLASLRNYSFWTTTVFETARRKIAKLLGPFNWDEAALGFDFGPGATTRLRRISSDRFYKFSGIPECTANNLVAAYAALKYFNAWGQQIAFSLKAVEGNKVVTVAKNAKTDRVIAIEPCMNIFIQKGIGSIIRRRLKKVAVDLNDQTKNQRLAREGSIDGSLATIDLSAASDSVSTELVRCLLPPDWVEVIFSSRSEKGVLPDGTTIVYRKVSSMGNGFTFELESLIFWALCSSVMSVEHVSDRRLAVYGDDIIVPSSCSSKVIDILAFAGFAVNAKKTFVHGPFRESCGKHYFNGCDVTPIYVKDRVDNYPRYFWICNQIKRWSYTGVYGLDPLLKPAWDLTKSHITGFWGKARIPDGIGDGALIGDFDEVLPKKAPRGFHGWSVQFFVEKRSTFLPETPPILLKSLFTLEKRGDAPAVSSESFLAVPLQKRRYSVSCSVVWQWQDLGPWLA
jgi:hypothetical protein